MIKLMRLLVGLILLYTRYVSGMGLGGFASGVMGMGGMGFGGSAMGYGGGMNLLGGSEASGGSFGQGKKMFDDLFFKKGFGSQGGSFGMGQSEYGSGGGLVKDVKGEMGFHNGHHGGKNIMSDGKGYFGSNHIGTEGQNAGIVNEKEGHKKGRTVKGFHTQHESNEASNTEEVYDEEHDEADKKALKQAEGAFGDKSMDTYKGEEGDTKFASGQSESTGKFEKAAKLGEASAAGGQFGGKKYGTSGDSYGLSQGGDVNGMAGHYGANNMFKTFKH